MGQPLLLMMAGALRLLGFVTDPWLSDRDIHRVVGRPEGPAGGFGEG